VSFKARGRVKAFDNQLPDLLITIAASLKAGHSFRHAVQAVVDEGAEPAPRSSGASYGNAARAADGRSARRDERPHRLEEPRVRAQRRDHSATDRRLARRLFDMSPRPFGSASSSRARFAA